MPITPIPFDVGRAAILVIDAQRDLLEHDGLYGRRGWHDLAGADVSQFAARSGALIEAMRQAGRPIVFVRTEFRADYQDAALADGWTEQLNSTTGGLVEGTPGASLIGGLIANSNDFSLVKKGQDAFLHTHLDRLLSNLRADQCLIVGTDLLHSVSNTMRQGRALGYDFFPVLTAPDGIATSLGGRGRLEVSLSYDDALTAVRNWRVNSMAVKAEERSALIVVDIQNDFFGPDRHPVFQFEQPNNDEIIANNRSFAQTMRDRGWPVIYAKLDYRPDAVDNVMTKFFTDVIRRDPPEGRKDGFLHRGGHGAEFAPGLGIQPEDIILEKKGHSAFGLTHLHRMLRNLGVAHCYVSGGAAGACVSETVRDAVALGYKVTVLEDAVYPANSPHLPEVLAKYSRVLSTNDATIELRQLAHLPGIQVT
jgi:nicotinamidase-related amidase